MNKDLKHLLPYPFERLRSLLAGIKTPSNSPIPLHIGEPRHPTPRFIIDSLHKAVPDSLDRYPAMGGSKRLRDAAAKWLERRFSLLAYSVNPENMVIPVNGTREALFSFCQAVVDNRETPTVALPNPCYQIYEGAALLSGAQPLYLNCEPENRFLPNLDRVTPAQWDKCQLFYLCSPGNPTGAVADRDYMERVLELSDTHDFVIASDECYSEIYLDEKAPPVGLLQIAQEQGREFFQRCVVFQSLSKRSNVPGLRSGFVAGDPTLLEPYAKYRSYHGCALPLATQMASTLAWEDESHVQSNRSEYQRKFQAVLPILANSLEVEMPSGAFYLWPKVEKDEETFARNLFEHTHVTVLPGRYLSRPTEAGDPGIGRVRISLVAKIDVCKEAARRISEFIKIS